MNARFDTLQTWLTDDGPIARGLPDWVYTDASFWVDECETVFADTWVFAGFAHEIPKPGDALPVTIAGKPVLLLRNEAGEITAFHNVCSHRCLTLVDQPKNVGKLIRCPYHAWAYDLKGSLKASPHFGGPDEHEADGFDRKDLGLKSIRTHIWHHWIFVNMSGDAEDFESYAAPLMSRLDGIDLELVEPVAVLDFGEIETNWKFIMENFIEPYHVQFVHASTTDQPLKDHYTIKDGVCLGSAVDLAEEIGTSGSLGVSSRYLTLFPNFIVGRYFPDQLGVYLNIPLGPDRMIQKRAIYTTAGQKLKADDIEVLKNLWWDVHKEDHEICERMQKGRSSPVAQGGGLLSPCWEDSVRAFQELVTKSILKKGVSNHG